MFVTILGFFGSYSNLMDPHLFSFPVWCCAHSAQCCHLFMLASINGKKPPWLLLATCYPRRKQLPLSQHGGPLLRGPCRWSIWQRDAAGSTGTAAEEKEAGGLQIWKNTWRGLLLNSMHSHLGIIFVGYLQQAALIFILNWLLSWRTRKVCNVSLLVSSQGCPGERAGNG